MRQFILFLMIFITGLAGAQPDYMAYISEGLQRLEKGDYAGAVEGFVKSLNCDLNDPLGHIGLGITYLLKGQLANARAEFSEALELEPNLPIAYNGLGVSYILSGNLDKALEKLQAATKIDPKFKDTYLNLAYIYLLKDKPEEAIAACKFVQPEDENLLIRNLLGIAYCKKQMWDEAIDNLRAVVESQKIEPATSPLLVISKTPRKVEDLSTITSTKPQEKTTVNGLTTIRFYPSSQGKKIKYVIFYINDQPKYITNTPPYRYEWDTTAYPNGKHTVVITGFDDYEQIVFQDKRVLNVFNPETKKPRQYHAEKYAQAMEKLRDAIKLQPNKKDSYFLLAKAYQGKNNFLEAEKILEGMLLAEPENQEVRQALFELYKSQGRAPENLGEYWKIDIPEKKIALGLDDGPHPVFTPIILEILDKYEVKGTFFLVGEQAETYPNLVKQIFEKGHELANHTYSHRNLKNLSPQEIEQELLKTKVILREITGQSVNLLRPPGGHFNSTVREVARSLGYNTIFWSSNIGTFSQLAPQEIAQKMIAQASEGAIFLLHNGKDKTRFVLPFLIEGLRQQGYSFATVSELLAEGLATQRK